MKPSKKNKPSPDTQREFGGTLGESTRVTLSVNFFSSNARLIPDLFPPLRCPVHSHLASLDGPVADLCQSILRGQSAPVGPSTGLSWAAVGPSGPSGAAGLDQPARPPLFRAFREGVIPGE